MNQRFQFLVIFIFLFISVSSPILADEDWGFYDDKEGNLMRDLLMVDAINKRINDRFPVMYNHLLLGGYFNMPSSRMGTEGEIGLGYA